MKKRELIGMCNNKSDSKELQYSSEYINAILVRETSNYNVQKKQGDYTAEDYYALPDEERVELIDGKFYVMEEPHSLHQAIVAEVLRRIEDYIDQNNGKCIALLPVNVHLDADDKTVIGPDISIVCDRNKLQKGKIYGAPDFIVEVLSPSTKRKDMNIKLRKYREAGVREYWMIDPHKRLIITYFFERGEAPTIYGLDTTVPIRIFDGKCKINFEVIMDKIMFLYE